MDIGQFYKQRLNHFTALTEKYTQLSTRISILRIVWFLVWALTIYFSTFFGVPTLIFVIFLGLSVFVALVIWHNRIIALKQENEIYQQINQKEIKALEHDYSSFDDGSEFVDEKHFYSYDLDVFGPFSLFQYIVRSFSAQGKANLANRLKSGFFDAKEIERQQKAIDELSHQPEWLQEFRMLGEQTVNRKSKKAMPVTELGIWAVREDIFGSFKFKLLIIIIPVISFLVLYLLISGVISFQLFLLYMVVPLGISGFYAKRINNNHQELSKQADSLEQWEKVFKNVEQQKFEAEVLVHLQNGLRSNSLTASMAIKKLSKLAQAFDTRLNIFGWVLLNYFLLWDIFQSIRLEKWRKQHGKFVANWFGILAQMESLVSLATFKTNHSEYHFPQIASEGFILKAKQVVHPLVNPKSAIANPVYFDGFGQFTIVTGANMAGKSTYLRTVGTNMILAMAGSVVGSKEMIMSPVQLFTSIKTKDSLAHSESYFYAELVRLKTMIEALKSGQSLFIILDEILKGTNSKDKETGSKALIAQLLELSAVGIIATHDLQLGSLAQSFPQLVINKCFEVEITDGLLRFDYKIRDGISQNLNATFLMKQMGITGL
jgi:hypothetical protein